MTIRLCTDEENAANLAHRLPASCSLGAAMKDPRTSTGISEVYHNACSAAPGAEQRRNEAVDLEERTRRDHVAATSTRLEADRKLAEAWEREREAHRV